MNRAATACLIASMFLNAASAQDVPPPPRPGEEGPSLEVTMKYILDKITSSSPSHYLVSLHHSRENTDLAVHVVDELSQVTVSEQNCLITTDLPVTTRFCTRAISGFV